MRLTHFSVLLAMVLAGVAGCSKKDLSTPKAAAKTFANALDNGDTQLATESSTGVDAKTIESMSHAMANMKKLKTALISKFGEKEASAADPSETMVDAKALDDATETVNGDTATVSTKQGRPLQMKKVDGSWKVDMSELSGALGGAAVSMMDSVGKAAVEVANDVDAGKYKTAAEARQGMAAKMFGNFGSMK